VFDVFLTPSPSSTTAAATTSTVTFFSCRTSYVLYSQLRIGMQSAYILRRTTLLISLVGWLVMQMYRGETAGRLELPLIIGVTLLGGAGAESPRIRKL